VNQLEHIGALYVETQRLTDAFNQQLAEYRKLLDLLSTVKADPSILETIRVNVEKQCWDFVIDLSKPPQETAEVT